MRGMEPVKVYSCATRVQADIVVAALNSSGIAAYRQSGGSGDYMDIYMGTSMFGEDIFVDMDKEKKAKEIIAGITLPVMPDDEKSGPSGTPSEEASLAEAYRRRKTPVRILCLIVGILMLAGAVIPSVLSIIFG